MALSKLRVGYVPEHFAAPLLQLADTPWGKTHVELIEQPSGTGQMLTSLDAAAPGGQKIDVAVALTEALIAGVAKGRSDYQLVGTYVRSSLNWAIIAGTERGADRYQSVPDLRDAKVGVSRLGSGSHIMASVLALEQGWVGPDGKVAKQEFVVNNDFKTLRDGVNQVPGHETGFFMWEWFTTKPYRDTGEIRFLGSIPTPWSSWAIAASKHTATVPENAGVLKAFLDHLDASIRAFANPSTRADHSLHKFIQSVHQYKPEDVEAWAEKVRWAGEETPDPEGIRPLDPKANAVNAHSVSGAMILNTLRILEEAGVLQRPANGWSPASFVDTSVAQLL
ncbi:hypothetical protein MVES1_001794 [Malassezia vespertilionis]|uniref:Ca3427-like PBP 2 domain-containing protein n=1 Tax=Malassezia vespertilionis TaxID=2020962 RepID=A0A2N1JDF7_9BASI|nr:uncharacterized protein MVES1_001794 [Malassezia vespertilionis]PKI84569.1 hypothetical protein MVES_001694 [Malassezia vespertilionis]WFD06449.1 hypothetical protein MVES1_001794 [Malassezia vespertilionis]